MHRSRTHSKKGNARKATCVHSSKQSITCTKPAYNVFHILPEKNASLSFNARTRLAQSLFELNELEDRLSELNDKHPSTKRSLWLQNVATVPKSATLTMTQVRRLAAHRHELHHQHHKKTVPYLYVVEPQCYDKITLLTPSHYMFEENRDVHTKDSQEVGYFHSGKSGLAQSGDGGDFGDLWWVANPVLVRWIDSKLRSGRRLLDSDTV